MDEILIQELEDEGGEVRNSIKRMMGDSSVYYECLMMLPNNENIKKLHNAVMEKDYSTAEKEVHTLKGMALNLGLVPLIDVCMDLLMDLRDGETDDAEEELEEIEKNFKVWVNIITKHNKT